MNEQEKQKIRKDWELEFDEYLSKYEHKWCRAHDEGQYCHLDNVIENKENVVPYIKNFISKTIKSKLEAVEGEIQKLDTYWRDPTTFFPKDITPQSELKEMKIFTEVLDIINKHK